MKRSFSKRIKLEKETVLAIVIPQHRQDGMYYEVNIKGYPRFYMKWSEMDRYDLAPDSANAVPYSVVLAVSDAIEEEAKRY